MEYPNGEDDESMASVEPQRDIKDIIQERFKADETVNLFFEVYQTRSHVDVEGLLALVTSTSGGTYGIVSFTILRTPLRSSNELKVDKVFPLDKKFAIMQVEDPSNPNQFKLCTDIDESSKYSYRTMKTDNGSAEFEEFFAAVASYKSTSLTGQLAQGNNSANNFDWLDDYRDIGDVKQELKKRESEFIEVKDYTVYCATWNVNGKQECMNDKLSAWLARGNKAPDIYAIGLQEMDNTTMAILTGQNCEPEWQRRIVECLYQGTAYVRLKSVRLNAIFLTIYVRRSLLGSIPHPRTSIVRRGLLNAVGNKGGVAVSMQLNETTICFVNSHLAAHMHCIQERNEDFKGIEDGLRFEKDNLQYRTIHDHDHIFWIGDLNYRVNEPNGVQRPLLRNNPDDIKRLLQHDQLHAEMMLNRCFTGYSEGEIKFWPTYKFNLHSSVYDTSERQRAPAFCDRVLWKSIGIDQLCYDSVMEMISSDHKPVYSVFNVKIRTKNETAYRRVLKDMDKRENDNQPQIITDPPVINLGLVRFNQQSKGNFKVSNNCPQKVEFQFKENASQNDICERWISVIPSKSVLHIDSSLNISITMMADPSSITGLLKKIRQSHQNFGDFDVLVLDVISGRDIFIAVTGEYKPSCFGLSIETMCRTSRPVDEYNQEEIRQLMKDESPDFRVTMPREFFLLIDYLHKQGDQVRGIFTSYAREQTLSPQFNAVRDWLDTWSEAEFPGTPQTAAEALLLLLDLPEEPLLSPFVDDLLRINSRSESMLFIWMLSPPKLNVFMHLCLFLREGIERKIYEPTKVATLFGRILLRTDTCILDYNNRCSEFMRLHIFNDNWEKEATGNIHGLPIGGGQTFT